MVAKFGFLSRGEKSPMNARVFLVVALAVILLFKKCDSWTFSGSAFEAAGWKVVSLDIVLKFEPAILCDIRRRAPGGLSALGTRPPGC